MYLYFENYSEVQIIRPPMVLVESGLNSKQVSLMRFIWVENCISVLKQVVKIKYPQSHDLQQQHHASVTCQKRKQTLKSVYVNMFINTEL